MKTIPLSQGKVALVDDCDFERVSTRKWYAAKDTDNLWYAVAVSDGVRLHRFILGVPDLIDHRNGNGLDCRRSNLRIASVSQNQHNVKVNIRNTTGYRGVYRHGRRWYALAQTNKQRFYLGCYATAREAAEAYDQHVRATRGEFGRTNF